MFNKYVEFFESYMKKYDKASWGIDLKYIHTFRVITKCEELANSLNLSKEDVELSKTIGLFHDIGRFYQYKKYNKFSDHDTINHADMGVRVLKDNDVLDDDTNKELILKAISNHNKYKLEDNLSKREELFCKLIRDADKLDIWELAVEDKINPFKYQGHYSSEVINDLLEGRSIELTKYDEKIDKSLGMLGMFFDINFPYTKEYIIKHNILDLLVDKYIESNKVEKDNLLKIKDVIKERLCIQC